MAAYAAAVSLMHIIDLIKNHPSPPISPDKQQFDSLTEVVTFLQEFLEGYVSPFSYSDEADPLEMRIADAAYAAEDVIESYIVDSIHLAAATTTQDDDDYDNDDDDSDVDDAARATHDDDDVGEEEEVMDNIQLVAAATHHEDEQTCCFNLCKRLRKVIKATGLRKKEALEMEMVKEEAGVHDDDDAMEEMEMVQEEAGVHDDDAAMEVSYAVKSVQLDAAATHHEDEQIQYIKFYDSLQKVIEAMDLIKEEAMEMETDRDREKGRLVEAEVQRIVSESSFIESKSEMVGLDDMRLQLLDKLTGGDSKCQIIPIVGMGGIGKTTLARNVFDDKLIKEHFDICVWATISLDHDIERTLREVLSQSKGKEHLSGEKSVAELGEELHKYLFGRRYLVVLDDMWSIEVWDKIRIFFPDCSQRSRIIVTTRILTLADLLTNSSNSLCLSFLNEVDSWTLFSNTVFGIEGSDPDLEPQLREIGEKIVRKCKGLPLSIAVIGGLLAKSERTQRYWEYVEANLNSIVNTENEEYCSRVLKLSYNHLPVYLKPCFLYMGVFDEDPMIGESELIRLWISEGFLKTKKNKSMRTIAKECLKELVDRNLIILVRELGRWGDNNKKYLKIHDLLRDLSVKEGEKQKFYYVLRERSPHSMYSQRCIVISENTSKENVRDALDLPMPDARSYISHFDEDYRLPQSRLLRTLNAYGGHTFVKRFYSFKKVFKFVNSQHLAIVVVEKNSEMIPSSIKMLWNLRTLVVCMWAFLIAPVEIWEMHQLEHMHFTDPSGRLYLPHPPPPNADGDMVIMKNLHTLKGVVNFDLNEHTVKRIPNIKNLEIRYGTGRVNCLSHLGYLTKLENLRLVLDAGDEYMQGIKFPKSLKKLALIAALESRYLELGDMLLQEISSLPLLQKLELEQVAFRSPSWETVEGQFPSLRSLKLDMVHGMEEWTVSDSFPLLRELTLGNMRDLKEIPPEIGGCMELRSILLYDCLESVVNSAIMILEEEEASSGKQSNLHVHVVCPIPSEAEAMQGLSESPNLHILA